MLKVRLNLSKKKINKKPVLWYIMQRRKNSLKKIYKTKHKKKK